MPESCWKWQKLIDCVWKCLKKSLEFSWNVWTLGWKWRWRWIKWDNSFDCLLYIWNCCYPVPGDCSQIFQHRHKTENITYVYHESTVVFSNTLTIIWMLLSWNILTNVTQSQKTNYSYNLPTHIWLIFGFFVISI